jgi:chemotaxis protein CheX
VDSSYILPFVKSIQNVFDTMLHLPVQVGSPTMKKTGDLSFDVSGIIGMSGDLEGAVILSFPTGTAERVIKLLTGMELSHDHADFADAIGELVNMVTGGAKAQFHGKSVSISCPSVIIGTNHVISGRKDAACISLPCNSDCGEFSIEVLIRPGVTGQNSTKPVSATANFTA